MSDKTKNFKIHKWVYKDRPHTIEIPIDDPSLIIFEMGFQLTGLNPKTWSTRTLSRTQKKLRQELYDYLTRNNLPNDNYILNLEGATMIKNDYTFITLLMTFPTAGDVEANKAFCDMFTDKMYKILYN